MLTLYYVSATFLQSWRIKSVCNKIAEKLAQQASVAFYTLPLAEDGYDANLATSELCINRSVARVSDILWLHGDQRGCCLIPRQVVHIAPWISFPEAPSWLPFAFESPSQEWTERWQNRTKDERLYLLLETEIHPSQRKEHVSENVRIEDYGKLIAWRIDSHLAFLIETDLEHFTKLLISTFLQHNLVINDKLPLLRIESINFEGKPQPFSMVASHLRKSTRSSAQLSGEEWRKHLENLHSLTILANQATEFEYNKNRTEGKTGVVKPDLIPHEKQKKTAASETSSKDVASTAADSTSSPKVKATYTNTASSGSKSTSPTAKTAADSSKTNSPAKHIIKADLSASEMLIATESPITVSAASKTSPSKLSHLKTKPTEIKKQSAELVNDGKFKTMEVLDMSARKLSSQESQQLTVADPQDFAKSDLEKQFVAEKSCYQATSASQEVEAGKSKEPTETKDLANSSTSAAAVNPSVSVVRDNSKRPSLRRNKDSLRECKPLNILVYSDSTNTRESTVAALKDILEKDMYTIYAMTPQQVEQKYWLENTALLVVCGTVSPNISEILVDFFLNGGKVFSLCSDILHFVLPTYRTAEVREHELVQFSYDKWQKVQMMHHIFCYQPSPVKKNFSTDSDDSAPTISRKPALVCPRSVELKDLHGALHNLDVKVLGTEETWNTPSLLLANSVKSGGKAVFSQVHLETNPAQFETDEAKFSILKKFEKTRLEIFSDLLAKHLNVCVKQSAGDADASEKCVYQNAFFLGHHESKFQMLDKLEDKSGTKNTIKTSKLTMHFCGKDEKPPHANTNVLPILIHSCPEDFSTVDYFDHLKTLHIGRLLIYAPIVSSSMNVINELELTNGLAVLVRQQTDGVGRGNNQWLSPLGCAMFSIQLHIPLDTPLGARLPLIQHIVATAIVSAIRNNDVYKVLDIGIKWPNDIYANEVTKIGGLIVKTILYGNNAVVNIGCGINLDNSKPTICINDLINEYNRMYHKSLPLLKYEQFVAMMFNEIERLVGLAQKGDFRNLYKMYYDLWLHNEQTVSIANIHGEKKEATVVGIDDYGYLKVKLSNGSMESVQPDGNTFDILKGLIVPKFN